MSDNKRYFVVTEKAVPDVLLKVVEAKKLLETQKSVTVQEAVDSVGISRSSFYKYNFSRKFCRPLPDSTEIFLPYIRVSP